mmetsp:Transcript_21778/g.41618  ORF Transcript_21778/g.41618 Transcript_21778/m.41618 type:complete len:630 (+) Transcript_21778:375-2264(+)
MLIVMLSSILLLSNMVASDKMAPRRFRSTPPTATSPPFATTHPSDAAWQNSKSAKADTSSKSSKTDVVESSSHSSENLSQLYSMSFSYSRTLTVTDNDDNTRKSSKSAKNRNGTNQTEEYSPADEEIRNLAKSSKSSQFVSVESSSKSSKSDATKLYDISNSLSLPYSISLSYSLALAVEKDHGIMAKSFKITKDRDGIEQTPDHLSADKESRKSAKKLKSMQFVSVEPSSKSSNADTTEPSYDYSDDLPFPYSMSFSHSKSNSASSDHRAMAKSFKITKDRNSIEQTSDHLSADEEIRKSAKPLKASQFVFIVPSSKSSKSKATETSYGFSYNLSLPCSMSLSHSQSYAVSKDHGVMAKSFKSTKYRDSVDRTSEYSSVDEEPRNLAKSSKSSYLVSYKPSSKSSKSQPMTKTDRSNKLSDQHSYSMSIFYLVSGDNGTMAKSSKRFKSTKDRSDIAQTAIPSNNGYEYKTFSKSSKTLTGPSDFASKSSKSENPGVDFDKMTELSFSYTKFLSYSQSLTTDQKSGKSSKSFSSADYSFAGRSKSFKSTESELGYMSSNDNAMSFEMSYSLQSKSLMPSDQSDSISITTNDVEPELDSEATSGVERVLHSTAFVWISVCAATMVLIST